MNKKDAIRRKIEKLEQKIAKEKVTLGKLRSSAKPQPVEDYVLTSADGKKTKLSALFGNKKELIVVHNMGSSCPYCTLWADGFNGLSQHLESRAAFVIESPDSPKTQSRFKKSRGWKFKMVSSDGSKFRTDMGYLQANGDRWPGVSTFVKKNGKIFRHSNTGFGPGDNFCPAWDLFDLLPGGSGEWGPKFKY